jgi:uncharacterized protein
VGRGQEPAQLERKRIGFDYAARFFLNPTLEKQDDRRDYGKVRMQAIGQVGEDVLFVVYTDRNARHKISARLASTKERKSWRSFVEQWRVSSG